MIARYGKSLMFVFMSILLICGCRSPKPEKTSKKLSVLARGPNLESLPVPTDFVAEIIQRSGGFKAWMDTTQIEFDSVVALYQSGDDFYLTEHDFELFPWSDAISITAKEPQDKLVWQLVNGKFIAEDTDSKYDVTPANISCRDYSEAVLMLVTAPVRFLDDNTRFVRHHRPVGRAGLEYNPISRQIIEPIMPADSNEPVSIKPSLRYWTSVIFYQNTSNGIIDMIWFADQDRGKYLIVRGYDYKQVKDNGIFVPTKIEIFSSDPGTALKQRLVKIDAK